MATENKRPIHESASHHNYDTQRVDGSDTHLVFYDDSDELGRSLVGFSHPDGPAAIDWVAVRDELNRLGIGVGIIHHGEAFEPAEVGL